jgi:hypothetical protein
MDITDQLYALDDSAPREINPTTNTLVHPTVLVA